MQKPIDDVVRLMCSVISDGAPISSDQATGLVFDLMNKKDLRDMAIQQLGRHISNQAEMHPAYLEWIAQKEDKQND